MAKKPGRVSKTLTPTNLSALGSDRLVQLLLDAAAGDPAFKRRLRMELAAELGADDLASEIDKRLAALTSSRARVSWRKRPALLAELSMLRMMVVERLAPLDQTLALERLVAWFDLFPGLSARVSDAKGELPLLFERATDDLAALSNAAGVEVAAPLLGDAITTRLNPWGSWIGRAAGSLDRPIAARLLSDLVDGRPLPTGRMALPVRHLAERAGDLDVWAASFSDEERRKVEIAAEIAGRLARAGRPSEARTALDRAARKSTSLWRRAEAETEERFRARVEAEIAILEAEGRSDDARDARWTLFERTPSAAQLGALIEGLQDFEDVVAVDRAVALAAAHPDVMKALAFLMEWPALREAAELIVTRSDEVRAAHDDVPLWASRLAGRHPAAALILLRKRALALMSMGSGFSDEVATLLLEAEALADDPDAADLESHAVFLQRFEDAAQRRRGR